MKRIFIALLLSSGCIFEDVGEREMIAGCAIAGFVILLYAGACILIRGDASEVES
jgi:hypothetical protein